MKKIIICLMALCTFDAYAANENAATSKEYVDTEIATKQPIIPAQGNNVVMTFDSTADNGIGAKQIYDETASYAEQQDALVTAGTANAAVQMAINGEFYCKEWSTIVENDCWLWGIKEPVAPSRNLFDVSKIPDRTLVYSGTICENNGDGTITVTDAPPLNSAIYCGGTLGALAPGLIVNNTYTLSFDTNGTSHRGIYLDTARQLWLSGQSKTITQEMLDSLVYFYASYNGQTPSTATISNIQIELGTVATPYQPYGQNTFIPQNQQ